MKYIIEGIAAFKDEPLMRAYVENRVKEAGIVFPCEAKYDNGWLFFGRGVSMPLGYFGFRIERDESERSNNINLGHGDYKINRQRLSHSSFL